MEKTKIKQNEAGIGPFKTHSATESAIELKFRRDRKISITNQLSHLVSSNVTSSYDP